MPVQLKDKRKTKQAPTAGPSADDRGTPAAADKPIEARLVNVVGGTDVRPRIQIAGGGSRGVEIGMKGYIKKTADEALATFVIDEVKGESSFAYVEIPRASLRSNAFVVINATPPKRASHSLKPRLIAYSADGTGVKITIGHGSDHGVVFGMQGQLVNDRGEKGQSFTTTEVEARRSYAKLEHTTPDEAKRYTLVDWAAPPPAAVQRRGAGAPSTAQVESTAQAGVAGASSSLPFLDIIQRSFGKHDVSGVRAQVGGPAANASRALGAQAYATGNTVAFASAPDLHTAAHEAAHTVQQARGAVGFQGLGAADDEHERHADAVADAVVAGQSAEALLDGVASGPRIGVVQRKTNSEMEAVTEAAALGALHAAAVAFDAARSELEQGAAARVHAHIDLGTRHLEYAKSRVGNLSGHLGELSRQIQDTSHALASLLAAANDVDLKPVVQPRRMRS